MIVHLLGHVAGSVHLHPYEWTALLLAALVSPFLWRRWRDRS